MLNLFSKSSGLEEIFQGGREKKRTKIKIDVKTNMPFKKDLDDFSTIALKVVLGSVRGQKQVVKHWRQSKTYLLCSLLSY